ncbi:MAG: site-specific integrase [Candidatus Methanoplasma sp.]|jgi:integrase/recombinase XerC|nr:site-specific integrase [Candidatus Methanoplasma sp.]
MAAVNRFMESYSGVYSDGTYSELQRRYPKIARQFILLHEKRKVGTSDPHKFTPEDIKEYIIFQRKRGLKDKSVFHDLGSIKNLCMFLNGNNCVDVARAKYPTLFQHHRHIRLPVTERPEYDRVIAYSHTLSAASPYLLVRACALCVLAYCSGLRTQELQHAKVRHLDTSDFSTIYLDHVKGMSTYGTARTVPIHPDAAYILGVYLSVRDSQSSFLFPGKGNGPLVTNTLSKDRTKIIEQCGVEFDFRKTRRTYAQFLIDEGASVDDVAIILGHSSSKTTEMNYARPRDDRVVAKIIGTWRNEKKEK